MLLTATLALLTSPMWAPQDPRLQLPPRETRPGNRVQNVPEPQSEVERFRRDLFELHTSASKAELLLQEIGQKYPRNLEGLMLTVARSAGTRELQDLVLVAKRYGKRPVADALLFQALARPLGPATRPVLEAMVQVSALDPETDNHRQGLMQLIRGRISASRKHATDLLAAELTTGFSPDELQFALQLSGEQNLDLQLSGVQLLGAIQDDQARQRLIALLAKEATVAGAACEALIGGGEGAASQLRQVLAEPAQDRAFGYAALALAVIGDKLSSARPGLVQQLRGSDPLLRCLCAVPLADLCYMGEVDDVATEQLVMEALLNVVEPRAFVANIDMLRGPATARLQLLSGRVVEARTWREWWRDARPDFVGMRENVVVDAANSKNVLIMLSLPGGRARLLGEALAGLPPLADCQEVVLSGDEMLQLVRQLQDSGLSAARQAVYGKGVPQPRSLQLQVVGARTQVTAPAADAPLFDALVGELDAVLRQQSWQLFRDPAAAPDRAAFWRSERQWLEANPDPLARDRRLLLRVVRRWPQLGPRLQQRALEQLYSVSQRQQLLAESDGAAIVAMLRQQATLDENDLRLLELAVTTPGDKVWRDIVDVATSMPGAGPKEVSRVFSLLGPDAVLQALQDSRPLVRSAAIDEVVQLQDLRAGPRLLQLLDDADDSVARSAVFACGALALADSRKQLFNLVAGDATSPGVRREALRSIGRIGGEGAFELLQRALAAPQREDRQAALRGLGELRERRAAQLLAELFVASPSSEAGDLARFYLQRLGAKLAVPALRGQLQVQNQAVRQELVTLLASYQDPVVVPDLIQLLREGHDNLRMVACLEGITGLDITSRDDRIQALERWYRDHKLEPQWRWLLQALQRDNVPTSLADEQFAMDGEMTPVPELARLLVEAKAGRLRSLCAAVLRTVTGEDYGNVSAVTPVDVRENMAARYRALFESARAALKR